MFSNATSLFFDKFSRMGALTAIVLHRIKCNAPEVQHELIVLIL